MGYQQSFLKFNNADDLKIELSKYQQRDTSDDQAGVYGVVRVIKPVTPFNKGELALVVGGERYAQRNTIRVEEELGIENVQEVVFIDNPLYWEMSNGEIGKFLDEHFETIKDEK